MRDERKIRARLRQFIKRAAFWCLWPAIAVIAWGGTLELLQAVVGRDAEWSDMLANTLGAAAGILVALLLLRTARLVDRRHGD
jgi:VanZ family protein